MIFGFIAQEKAHYPVTRLCRVLGVSVSGYYAWCGRGPSARAMADDALTTQLRAIHAASRQTYGTPRMHAELAATGTRCGRKRVARLLRAAGLVGCHRRRWTVTTQRDAAASPAPDHVRREFTATAPNQLWTADITYVPTWSGFLYLAVVLDVYSRRIIGWAMADHLRTAVVLDALEMALWNRRPARGVIHHSDHGCQYTSLAFGTRLREAGIAASMGTVGDACDNAITESFFATLECELLQRQSFRTHRQARLALFNDIEGFYNSHRRHSALGYLAPAAFERQEGTCVA